MADEVCDESGGGAVVERIGIGPLVLLAFMHHADGVANGKGF